MTIGFGLLVVSGLWLMSLDLNVDMDTLCANACCRAWPSASSGCR